MTCNGRHTEKRSCGGGCGGCSSQDCTPAGDAPFGLRLVVMAGLVFILPLLALLMISFFAHDNGLRSTGMVIGSFLFLLAVLPMIFRRIFNRKVQKTK